MSITDYALSVPVGAMSRIEESASMTRVDRKYLAVLETLFDGPRWLTAPPGYRFCPGTDKPKSIVYSIVWHGLATTVEAKVALGRRLTVRGYGVTGATAADCVVKRLTSFGIFEQRSQS